MEKQDVDKLDEGIYRIVWKDGTSVIAAVGIRPNGNRWMAPVTWASGSTDKMAVWGQVQKTFKLEINIPGVSKGG